MSTVLGREELERVIRAAADRLEGDWLLIEGGLVALWLLPGRTTEDVDLVGLAGTGRERLALMELAAELGLSIEAVNSAADFFVRRIPGWQSEFEPFVTGARGRILRPSPTLFLLLKLPRLSAHDLDDCRALLARVAEDRLALDLRRVTEALGQLPPTGDPGLQERRKELAAALAAFLPAG